MASIVLVLGAGSTRADSSARRKAPPLDREFFSTIKTSGWRDLDRVATYLENEYEIDIFDEENDSYEKVLTAVYAEVAAGRGSREAKEAFRALLRILNRRLAETTNPLLPTRRRRLYRLLCRFLDRGFSPSNITIITFNYDLWPEQILDKLQTSRSDVPGIFNFPHLYGMNDYDLTWPKSSPIDCFDKGKGSVACVSLFKLHGSQNWYSSHTSSEPSPAALLRPTRNFSVTRRRKISPRMTVRQTRRTYAFPVIVPPVPNKAGVLHRNLVPVWTKARQALQQATDIVIYGYSCPEFDAEAANLLRGSVMKNAKLTSVSIIDKSPITLSRLTTVLNRKETVFYRKVGDYLA